MPTSGHDRCTQKLTAATGTYKRPVPSYQASQNAHMNGREGHRGEALVEQLLAAEAAEGGGVTFL